MSLMWRSRLSNDSARSPRGATTATTRPRTAALPSVQGWMAPTRAAAGDHHGEDQAPEPALPGLVGADRRGHPVAPEPTADDQPADVVGHGGNDRSQEEGDAMTVGEVRGSEQQRGERSQQRDPTHGEQGGGDARHRCAAFHSEQVPQEGEHDDEDQHQGDGRRPLGIGGDHQGHRSHQPEQGGRVIARSPQHPEAFAGGERHHHDAEDQRRHRAQGEEHEGNDGCGDPGGDAHSDIGLARLPPFGWLRVCPGMAGAVPASPETEPPSRRRTRHLVLIEPLLGARRHLAGFGLGGDRYLACFGLGIEVDPTDHPLGRHVGVRPGRQLGGRTGRGSRRSIGGGQPGDATPSQAHAGDVGHRGSGRFGGQRASAGIRRCPFRSPDTEPGTASLAAGRRPERTGDGWLLFGPESIEILVAGAGHRGRARHPGLPHDPRPRPHR